LYLPRFFFQVDFLGLGVKCIEAVATFFHVDRYMQGKLEPVYRAALALGTANQLTNILRDVGEDIRERNRVYIPLDELRRFNITEAELVGGMHCTTTGKMDDRYVQFMQYMVLTLLHPDGV
jgi:phytoene/squalene synthetase